MSGGVRGEVILFEDVQDAIRQRDHRGLPEARLLLNAKP